MKARVNNLSAEKFSLGSEALTENSRLKQVIL